LLKPYPLPTPTLVKIKDIKNKIIKKNKKVFLNLQELCRNEINVTKLKEKKLDKYLF